METVHLAELEISNFRNLEKLAIRPHKRFNIVAGRNGMGKTNLLEAIYLMGALRSFRTTARSELLGPKNDRARIRGVFKGAAAGLCCEIELTDRKRVIRVDGKTASARGEHFRSLPMVLFHPATMALVQSGPDTRRRFLDRALFQADAIYPGLHRDYMTALKSRNKLLKQSPPAKDAIAAFDGQLSSIGARISEKRAGIVETMGPFFKEAVEKIGMGLEATASYRPKVEGGEEEILNALETRLELDLIRGYTSVGPHADDVEIEVNGRPARRFASQGQQRMIALSLKIAETNVLAQATERIPVLLLDDISSELDRDRNRQLFEFLGGVGGQVFITTTHFDHILLEGERMDLVMQEGLLETKTS